MKKLSFLFTGFLFLLYNGSYAQDILKATNGSVISVTGGGILYVNGGINADNGSTINNAGTITIARTGAGTANFTDNTVTPYAYGTGKFSFIGTSGVQTMRGLIFNDLEINNAAGVTMLGNVTVNNTLFLTTGTFAIGNNTLNTNGAISGAGKLRGSSSSVLNIGGTAGILNFDQTDSTTRSLKDIVFNSGSATLGNAMQVYGLLGLTGSTFHVNGQSLVLKSIGNGAVNTARVGNLTGSIVDGATNVTVERYIASPQRAWHLLSAKAVTGSQTIKQAWQENGGPFIAGQGTLLTSNLYNGSNGFDMASISSSVLTHNQGGVAGPSWNYNVANTNSTVLSSSPGYMLFVRGDRRETPATIPSTEPTVLRTNGTLTQGNQTAFISSTGPGRTLVGNPYASPIDMEPVFAATANLAQDMYIWDPALTGNYGVGGFRLVERIAANTYQQTPVVLGGGATADATARYIHSGQAMFLRTTGTAGTTDATVNFTEATKASSVSVVNPIINTAGDQQLFVNLLIVNPGNIESLADGIRVRYDASYQAGIADDVEKMGNFAENISSYRETKKLIVEKRPMISSTDTIFLRISNTGIKDYRLQAGTFNFIQTNVTAYLQDAFTGANSVLDLTGAINNIDFAVTSNPASAAPDRFRIVFTLSAPLPVTITSLKAAQQGKNIAVEWKVSNQVNVRQYEVERSADGAHFAMVAAQPATGINGSDRLYNWLDLYPGSGDNFYRIRVIDIGGDTKYSNVVKVQMAKADPLISIYPNPVISHLVNVQFTAMAKGVYRLQLINTLGQVMFTQLLTHAGGDALQVVHLNNIAAGNYQLEIILPDNTRAIRSLNVVN